MRACVVPSARAERAAQRELLQPWRAQAYVHGLLVEPELVRDGCHGDAGCARTQALCGSKNEGRKEEEAAPAAARDADFVLEACFARAVTDPTLTFRDQRACCAPNLHMHNQELSKETLSCHISLKFSNSKSRYIGYTSHLQKAAAVRLRLTCVVLRRATRPEQPRPTITVCLASDTQCCQASRRLTDGSRTPFCPRIMGANPL